MSYQANILVTGKTGSGKSSLINYLYGKNVRKVGVGRSITEKGIFKESFLHNNNFKINIYDTWGLQTGDTLDWMDLINKKLEEQDGSSDIKDWFHSIFYCISMGASVVEDFEITLLANLLDKSSNVLLVLTNCDTASPGKISDMKKTIREHPQLADRELSIVELCSVEKKLRSGAVSYKYGREKALDFVFYLLWQKIVAKFPPIIIREIKQMIGEFITIAENTLISDVEKTIKKSIKEKNVSLEDRLDNILSMDFDMLDDLLDDDFLEPMLEKCQEKVKSYISEATGMYKAYYGVVLDDDHITADVMEKAIDIIGIFGNDDDEFLNNILKQTRLKALLEMEDLLEDESMNSDEGSLKDIFIMLKKLSGPVFEIGKIILSWQSCIREIFAVLRKETMVAIDNQEEAIKNKLLEIGREHICVPMG